MVRRCSKCLCAKDDQRTYSFDPLKNIHGVSPPLGTFSSACPVVTSAEPQGEIEETGAYVIF